MKKGMLIAVGAAIALLALVLVFMPGAQQVDPGGGRQRALPGFDPARVTGLEVTGVRRVTLQREGDGWAVFDPDIPEARYVAEAATVKAALEALARVDGATFVTGEVDRLSELWLDRAKGLSVRILTQGGAPLEMVLGKDGASNDGTYVLDAATSQAFEHPVLLGWLWRRRVMDWRDPRLVRLAAEDISQLVLRVADEAPVTLTSDGTPGGWRLAEGTQVPEGFRFNPGSVEQLARDLVEVEAQDMLVGEAAAQAAQALSRGRDTVEARLKNGRTVALHLGRPAEPGLLAPVPVQLEGDARLFNVSGPDAARLRKRLTDLRDLRLLRFELAEVKRLHLEAGGRVLVMAKEPRGWVLVEPKQAPENFRFDESQVESLLVWLQQLEATRLLDAQVPDARSGLAQPSVVVEVSGGAQVQTLTLGAEVVDGTTPLPEVYARGSRDGFTYAVDEAARAWLARGTALVSGP